RSAKPAPAAVARRLRAGRQFPRPGPGADAAVAGADRLPAAPSRPYPHPVVRPAAGLAAGSPAVAVVAGRAPPVAGQRRRAPRFRAGARGRLRLAPGDGLPEFVRLASLPSIRFGMALR